MNWKIFMPLPLAALVVGTPLNVPKLKKPIPTQIESSCDYSWALHRYLEAYAYKNEKPDSSKRLLSALEENLGNCGKDSEVLKSRVQELRLTLFPEEGSSPRQRP